MPSYDVIIPTHDNLSKSRSIALTVKNLLACPTQPEKIIIISNGDNNPDCIDFLGSLCCSAPNILLLEMDKASRSAARNLGLRNAKAECILFVDDDILVSHEALESFLHIVSAGNFCCGARRRFIPYGWSYDDIKDNLSDEDYFSKIDKMASDNPSSAAGPRGPFVAQPHKVSFITCFGGAPREAILSVGGFDEEFDGWGLEDTDLMRRLLRHYSYEWLGDVTIWHLDHLISPFSWSEHWDSNWPIYLKGVRDHGYLQVTKFFSKSYIAAENREVLLFPVKSDRNHLQEELSIMDGELKTELVDYVEKCRDDINVGAIVLGGSSTSTNSPNDIDISKVTFQGGQRFSTFGDNPIPFDQHEISFRSVKDILNRPQYISETWLWWAHRYYSGIYVYEAIECRHLFRQLIQETLELWWLHFLSYHTGRALICLREKVISDRAPGLRHVAAIAAISIGAFPCKMRYPYIDSEKLIPLIDKCERLFTDESTMIKQDALINILGETISNTIDRYSFSLKTPHIVYNESAYALKMISSVLNIRIPFEWKALSG